MVTTLDHREWLSHHPPTAADRRRWDRANRAVWISMTAIRSTDALESNRFVPVWVVLPVDLAATNVPGPPVDAFFAGARIETLHAFAPPREQQ